MINSKKPSIDFKKEALRSLDRLTPRLESLFSIYADENPEAWSLFISRLEEHFPDLFRILVHLYGGQYDFFYHLEELTRIIAASYVNRPIELKTLDASRAEHPLWFTDHKMVGGVCYVDLFAGDLAGLRKKIPYFKEIGLTYLHLMPLFPSPEGQNDGGYAISSYRQVDPKLGSMEALRGLIDDLRAEGISLVLDFVFNHTSNEHEWAKLACAGDKDYQDFYRMYPDRVIPDAYEAHLREIFPQEHPGAFTYFEEIDRWVWTTFHSNQWDLNYANPELFNRMVDEMLFLANQGVEILRLDAIAFIWKELGTSCENLPEAHMITQAFNAIAKISAPALLLKSEAIVHPDEVAKYIHPDECQLSYNPLLMALLWNTLATREVNLLHYSMSKRFEIPEGCAWVNYVRCHDDIGWTFSDEDAASLGINAYDHRQFLNSFYTGQFEGSFGRGLAFQENEKTKDARISGTCASLAGLEKALKAETSREVDLAIRRILLIHNVILSIGGIPLIYLGDEVATLNDYDYRDDPLKADDSRWVHRPASDPQNYANRKNKKTIPGKTYMGLRHLIRLRKTTPAISGSTPEFVETGNTHIFGYIRGMGDEQVLILNNFSDDAQKLSPKVLQAFSKANTLRDKVSGETHDPEKPMNLKPFQYVWLEAID